MWAENHRFADARLPRMKVDPRGGDPGLVSEIKALAEAYDLSQESCRASVPLMLYRLLSKIGGSRLRRHLHDRAYRKKGSLSEAAMWSSAIMQIMRQAPERWIYERLPDHHKHGSLIRHFFYAEFDGSDYVVRFESLESVGTSSGRIYRRPGGHKVAMAGQEWEVGFHGHAIERIALRLKTSEIPTFAEYHLQQSAILNGQWAYQPVTLVNGEQGLCLKVIMDASDRLSYWNDVYVKEILKPDANLHPNTRISIVLGDLPVRLEGRYARAITFLYPGFSNTPESRLLNSLPPWSPERRRLAALIKKVNCHPTFDNEAVEAIKWFHLNGVPQVSIEGRSA